MAAQQPTLLPENDDAAWRVEELAVRAGVAVDTIRYYQKLGVLASPMRQGRVAFYGQAHLDRLGRISELADRGFTLAQITDLVDGESDPLLAQLAGSGSAAAGIDRDELIAQTGLDPFVLGLIVDAGLVPSGGDDDTFRPEVVSMLRAAAGLLDSGLPLDQLANLVTRHASHVDQLVADSIELFRANTPADRAAQSDMVHRLIPMVTEMVATHFERTLVEQAIDRIERQP